MNDQTKIDKLFNDCLLTDFVELPNYIVVKYEYGARLFDASKLEQHKEDIEYYMKYKISSKNIHYTAHQIALLIYAIKEGLPKLLPDESHQYISVPSGDFTLTGRGTDCFNFTEKQKE